MGKADLRAADIVLESDDQVLQVEVERTIVDLQAQLRAAQLKRECLATELQRPVRLVMAVQDTRAVRARLAPYADLVARTLPTSSRSIWAALRGPGAVDGDGILFVRERAITLSSRASAPTTIEMRPRTRTASEAALR